MRLARAKKAAAPPATSRHPNHSLPLLPSGPGGVCELSSRENRRGHHRVTLMWGRRACDATCKNWRRGRDSNPRSGYKPLTHFPGVLLQPLGHLSAPGTYQPAIEHLLRGRGRILGRALPHKRRRCLNGHPVPFHRNRCDEGCHGAYAAGGFNPVPPACYPDGASPIRHRRRTRSSRSGRALSLRR